MSISARWLWQSFKLLLIDSYFHTLKRLIILLSIMKHISISRIFIFCLALLSLASPSFADNKSHHWTYADVKEWGEITEFETCKFGKQQSPIDIIKQEVKKSGLPAIYAQYKPSKAKIINNGHTIQINLTAAGSFRLKNAEYKLVQLHFHTPSEEKINGKNYPMGAHLVHKSADGHLAVIALLIKQGKENAALKNVFLNLPTTENTTDLVTEVNVGHILPGSLKYYRFNGSLTTPPCSEQVVWHVVEKPIELSKTQINAFRKIFKNNARPIQPLNERVVEESI